MTDQAHRSAVTTDEEARELLQARVTFLFKVMFLGLLALICFLAGLYELDPENAPSLRRWVYLHSVVGLAAMAFIWRVLLVRRPLSMVGLYRLDLVYSLGIGSSFGAAAYLQHDLAPAGYLSVVYATFTVFARALIIPSSGARTAVASAITFVPMTASAAALSLRFTETLDLPGSVLFVGYLLFAIVAVILSAYGSSRIYDLRRQVSAAQLGQYSLDKKIGEGGMGVVHLAHHVLLRRPTAVKLVLPDRVGLENLKRFEREVQHMSQLTHPNTVAVYDYGHSDGVFYYAMEYLGGGIDLQKLVAKRGAQPSGRVASVLSQICGALHEAHTKSIIHRDIKPANVILCERGGMPDVAKVVDYGLVKEVATDTQASTQVVMGTPGYVAPEALTDPHSVGPAADIYAVGAVGYFLLTGKRVFEGSTPLETCIAHVTKIPLPPSQAIDRPVDPGLEAIILRCLEKKPEARFESAAVLRRALQALTLGDWSDADARAWWRDFRAAEDAVEQAVNAPTKTLTVELGDDRAA